MIQEWWGLVPHIEDVADRFAALGYVALAPDLYHGKSTVEAEEAHHLMEGLDWGAPLRSSPTLSPICAAPQASAMSAWSASAWAAHSR